MTIKSELVELQKANDGVLVPKDAVDWARSHPDSALHGSLNWDDASAAEQHRIWQVRQLIAIHVVNEKGVRQMVSLTIDRREDGGGYRDLDTVVASPDMRPILLADAFADLERVRMKYDALVELTSVWAEVRRVRARHQPKANGQVQTTRESAAPVQTKQPRRSRVRDQVQPSLA